MTEPTPVLPPDHHVHTEWSWDTWMTSMDACCAQAVRAGLPAVAFTEHVDFGEWGEADTVPDPAPSISRPHVSPLDVEGYLASVERCRARYPGLRIVTGIEAGEPHRFTGGVADVLARGRFERVLGSLHSLTEGGRLVGVDLLMARAVSPADVVRRYLAELVELVEGSAVFEVLAHADFVRRYWPDRAGPYVEKAFEDEYRAAFRALAGSDRVLEINTRSPLWSVDVLRWWREEGGRAVSFGSDAHQAYRVGARFRPAMDVVEAAGFRPGRDPFDFWRR